jgi:YD repeat-containing protein
MGNRTAETVYDAQGILRRNHTQIFDQLGHLIESIGAAGQRTRYGYDSNGNRIAVTDPLNRATGYGYDALDRLSSACSMPPTAPPPITTMVEKEQKHRHPETAPGATLPSSL